MGRNTDDTLPDVVRISTLHYITSGQQPERPPRMAPYFLMDKPTRLCYDKSKIFLF